MSKPKPLSLDMDFPYPKDIFPEITEEEWKKIDKLLRKEMGFSLDRVSANISRKMWDNMREWFIEQIKSACEFYLRYRNDSDLLLEEQNYFSNYWELFERFKYQNYNFRWEFDNDKYNEWLFKLAFKDVLEEEKW